MDLYIARHGESEKNAGLTELSDCRLSPLGEQQAQLAAQALAGKGIERIYCSALMRGLQTAAIIREELNVPVEVITELSERGLCGKGAGLSRSAILSAFPQAILPDHVDEEGWARHWEGETYEHMLQRMAKPAAFISSLVEHNRYSTVAFVTHNGSGTCLLRQLFSVSAAASVFFRHRNCGISHLRFEDGRTILLSGNDTHHLNGLPETSRIEV